MVCPREIAAREEPDRFQMPGVARIEDRQSIAEHVPHIQMIAVQHDLNAVGPAADVAVRDVTNAATDSLWRNRSVFSRPRRLRKVQRRRHAEECFHLLAAGHFAGFSSVLRKSLNVALSSQTISVMFHPFRNWNVNSDVHGFVYALGSSMVRSIFSVSASTRWKRSTTCMSSL